MTLSAKLTRARKIKMALAAGVAASALALSGCGAASSGTTKDDGTFTIGVSNALLSQAIRTQAMDAIQQTANEYIKAGQLKELVVESADTDVQGQVKQIQNLINRGVDAIIVNPSSDTALNVVLTQAISKGIKVVAFDGFLDLDKAARVSVDFPKNFQTDAEWVMKQMGGKGGFLRVDGIAGVPANQDGINAVDAALKKNPGVALKGTLAGNWDIPTSVQVTSSWLASGNQPDGVWASGGGVAQGVLEALVASGSDRLPPINGEGNAGWLRLAEKVKQKHPEFKIFTTNLVQPRAQGQAAIQIAMGLLAGKTLKETSMRLPGVEINDSNYQDYVKLAANLPDAAGIDVNDITKEKALELWFQ